MKEKNGRQRMRFKPRRRAMRNQPRKPGEGSLSSIIRADFEAHGLEGFDFPRLKLRRKMSKVIEVSAKKYEYNPSS
jgi:hypothetical protein